MQNEGRQDMPLLYVYRAWYWLIRLELVLFAVSASLFLLRLLQGFLL